MHKPFRHFFRLKKGCRGDCCGFCTPHKNMSNSSPDFFVKLQSCKNKAKWGKNLGHFQKAKISTFWFFPYLALISEGPTQVGCQKSHLKFCQGWRFTALKIPKSQLRLTQVGREGQKLGQAKVSLGLSPPDQDFYEFQIKRGQQQSSSHSILEAGFVNSSWFGAIFVGQRGPILGKRGQFLAFLWCLSVIF